MDTAAEKSLVDHARSTITKWLIVRGRRAFYAPNRKSKKSLPPRS